VTQPGSLSCQCQLRNWAAPVTHQDQGNWHIATHRDASAPGCHTAPENPWCPTASKRSNCTKPVAPFRVQPHVADSRGVSVILKKHYRGWYWLVLPL